LPLVRMALLAQPLHFLAGFLLLDALFEQVLFPGRLPGGELGLLSSELVVVLLKLATAFLEPRGLTFQRLALAGESALGGCTLGSPTAAEFLQPFLGHFRIGGRRNALLPKLLQRQGPLRDRTLLFGQGR